MTCRVCNNPRLPTSKITIAVDYVTDEGEDRSRGEVIDCCDDCRYSREVLLHQALDLEPPEEP